jgi:phosphocarrier protein HPr
LEVQERTFIIRNALGLHLRAANKVVRIASRFQADIWLVKDDLEVDAKSIMGITLLAAACGSHVKVKARGVDAREAIESLAVLFDSNFEEEGEWPGSQP